jgi:hypothetical protein
MRIQNLLVVVGLTAGLSMSPLLRGQTQTAPDAAKAGAPAAQSFDPHNLAGTWIGYNWGLLRGHGKGPGGVTNYGLVDQTIPEPPLTEWGKQHLLYKAITHEPLAGTHLPGWDRPGHICPNTEDPCFSADQYGVLANQVEGEYSGKDCESMSTPAIYDLPYLGQIEFIPTPDGKRIFQLFEYHREWRMFWMNREHPPDLDPTFEGDSTAHWEGDDLVVDTIGYNDKTMISHFIGHSKSDAFHLVEHFRLLDKDNLVIEMTFSDPKAWGDKSWPGFKKFYRRAPKEKFREYICSPRENQAFDNVVVAPENAAVKGMKGK